MILNLLLYQRVLMALYLVKMTNHAADNECFFLTSRRILFLKEAQYPAMDINGIDVIELRSTIERVEKDPSLGLYTFRGMTTWRGGARSSTDIRGFTIEGDEPAGLLGSNTAPNAVELVLAALGACLTVGVTYVAAQRGITIQSMDFTIEGELDIRGFFGMKGIHPGYEHIGVMVHLQADAKREELETLLTTVIETSPVRDIIARNVPVNIQLAKEE